MKKILMLLMGVLLLFVFISCDFISNTADIPQNTIDPALSGEALDRAILDSIYPKGLKESLDDQLAYAESHSDSRNFVDADIYKEIEGMTPAEAFDHYTDHISSEIRIPNDENSYLSQTSGSTPFESRYFLMAKSDNDYMITFYKIPGEISSIDKTETIYYISADSWSDQFTDASLKTEGWKTERVYYKEHNGKSTVSDREVIKKWEGEEAKDFFIDPDYSPFDFNETTANVMDLYTINMEKLYGAGEKELDSYFETFWKDIDVDSELEGQYSSFTRSLAYEDTWMVGSPSLAYAEQNDYYTEINNIQSFPAVLGMGNKDRGNVRAGVSYRMQPINLEETRSSRMIAIPDPDPLEIVNVNAKYFDTDNNFLMKDVKSFEYAKESSFPYVYHVKQFYAQNPNSNNGKYNFRDSIYYYTSDDGDLVRKSGLNSYDKLVDQKLTYQKGKWTGAFSLMTIGETSVEFYVDFFGDYLKYQGYFNGEKFMIEPDKNGDIETKLPGGGILIGHVTEDGELEITEYISPEK